MELDTTLLDSLLASCKNTEDIISKNGLLKQLTKGLMERALEGKMDDHLVYPKHSLKGKKSGNSHKATQKRV
jgi:putative transposase